MTLRELLHDASKSEAAEAKSEKCTKRVVQTNRKGKTPAREPITRSLQLPHIPPTAFSQTDLFLI